MKNIFISLLIISFFSLKGQTNLDTGFVEYGVKINNEAFKKVRNNNNKNISDSSLNLAESVLTDLKKYFSPDIPFLLLDFKKNEYILKPIEIMPSEGLNEKFIFRSSVYYGNNIKNIYFKKLERNGKNYRVSVKDNYDWNIKNEYKNILGYKCRKAVLNVSKKVKITAWFTPQISIAFSPVKYYGLPGAILEITTPLKHIYAKSIEFTDDVEIKKPTEGIKLSAEEYKQIMSGFKPPE